MQYVGGNFFDAATMPTGGAAYLVSDVLHDWGDAACVAILQNAAAAMPGTATVLVVDMVCRPVAALSHPSANNGCVMQHC